MSHVDDGDLHAYLDGALDALPAAEAERIRGHLASCEACSLRLEEERALRAEAEAILSGADPGSAAIPGFEEVRALASARRRPRAAGRFQRLGWAASIVAAVGLGWMLRGADPRWLSQPGGDDTGGVGSPPVVAEAARERGAEPAPADVRAGIGAESGGTRGGAAVEGGGVEPDGPAPLRPARARAEPEPGGADAAAAPMPAEAPPPAPAREAEEALRTLDAARERMAAAVADTLAATGAGRARGGVLGAGQRALPVRTDQEPGQRVYPVPTPAAAPAGTAEASGTTAPVWVPGLPVLLVAPAGQGFMAGTVRVLQLLDADTLELVWIPPGGVLPQSPEQLPDGRVQAAVPRDGGWLLGRARTTPDRIQGLLAQVKRGDGG